MVDLARRVGDLEANVYGQRNAAQAVTDVSTSLAGVSSSLAGVNTSLSTIASTLSTYGNVVTENVGTSGATVPLNSTGNTWGAPQTAPAFITTPVAFASLPTPVAGMRAAILDSVLPMLANYGTPVTVGGGTNEVPLFYDGLGATWRIG